MKSNVCKYVLYAFKSSKIQFMNAELLFIDNFNVILREKRNWKDDGKIKIYFAQRLNQIIEALCVIIIFISLNVE